MGKALRLLAAIAAVCILAVLTQAQTQTSKATSYKEKVLYAFTGGSDGWLPGPIVQNANGNFYGTTAFGGNMSGKCGSAYVYDGCGVAFEVSAAGKFRVLHTFDFSDGANPIISAQDSDGNLYGTTVWGGNTACQDGGCGVIFKLTTAGDLTQLYSFTGGSDGANPNGVIRDSEGNFYGTTGGSNTGYGQAFELTASGTLKVLYSFTSLKKGIIPNGVIRDSKGNLYGPTFQGGTYDAGTVFKLDTSGKETVLYSFKGKSDGDLPETSLIMDKEGNLYGTTSQGGYEKGNCDLPDSPVGCGTVFKIDTAGTFSVLVKFNSADGNDPGQLTEDAHGTIYGAARFGGTGCCGVVYKLNASGKEVVLYNFKAQSGGRWPVQVVEDPKGNLYGTAIIGGDLSCPWNSGAGCGVVFELTP